MGCLFVIILGGATAALTFFFGYQGWLLAGLCLAWLAAIIHAVLTGHHGFGGRGNTDAQILIAGLFIAGAVILPDYIAQQHCDQAQAALNELSEKEAEYFANHKTFTAEISLLGLTPDPNIRIGVPRADAHSFTASASHRLCTGKDGAPEIFTLDSAQNGGR